MALFEQLNFEKLQINPNLIENDKISKCCEIVKSFYSNVKIGIEFLRLNTDSQSEANTVIATIDEGEIFLFQFFEF